MDVLLTQSLVINVIVVLRDFTDICVTRYARKVVETLHVINKTAIVYSDALTALMVQDVTNALRERLS
jgi:hypothetical protein